MLVLYELRDYDCPTCGITFAVPAVWDAIRWRDQHRFFCPNGCPCYYDGEHTVPQPYPQPEPEQSRNGRLHFE